MSRPVSGSLTTLESLADPADIATLHAIGVYSVGQLAAWAPARDAELLLGLAAGTDEEALADGVALYVDEDKQDAALQADDLAQLPAYDLRAVDNRLGDAIVDGLGLESIGALAGYAPYLEARQAVQYCDHPPYCLRPSAPDWLLPEPVGATQTKIRMSNYVRDMPFEFPALPVTSLEKVVEPIPSLPVTQLFAQQSFKGWMGYLALFRQRWVNAGSHLGEVVHSLALAPGESRNISVVDWFARQQSARDEDSTASETLTATFHQKRAINEVVEATAVEHLYGQTDIDATTKTTGFGLTAGYGGGSALSNIVGGAAQLDLMQLAQLPVDVSAQGASSSTNSSAGGIGGSYVTSKGTLQGAIKSETGGSREVLGEVTQNISDSTAQNAANVRSLFSTVILEDSQSGRQSGQTRNVTNYNHSHALTVQYFEILQKYIVTTRPESLKPVVFLPFRPMDFDIQQIIDIWDFVTPLLKSRVPQRFDTWDYAIRNYIDENTAFDPAGEIKITAVTVTRKREFTAPCQVELDEANPSVRFSVRGSRLEDCLNLRLRGSSTYMDYEVVRVNERRKDDFSGGGIDTDETLTWDFSTDFQSDLKRELKELVDSVPAVVDFNGMEFNEISFGTSNRNNLRDDVNATKYRFLNGNEGIDLTLDFIYTLSDQNGNTQIVTQSEHTFLSWQKLHNNSVSASFSVNDAIDAYLSGVADINPTRTIDEILGWFRFHRYSTTKYLLNRLEDEQIVDAIERLGLGPVQLTRFIDPNPLGMVDNYLIFALRDMRVGEPDLPQRQPVPVPVPGPGADIGTATITPSVGIEARREIPVGRPSSRHRFGFRATLARADGRGRPRIITGRGTSDTDAGGALRLQLDGERSGSQRLASQLSFSIDAAGSEPRTRYAGSFLANPTQDRPIAIDGAATRPDHKNFFTIWANLPTPRQGAVEHRLDIQLLDVVPQRDTPSENTPRPQLPPERPTEPAAEAEVRTPLIRYLDGLDAYLALSRANPAVEVLHLPTPGVFGEAVLGRSNASEFIDPYRFHNWQDSPIPHAAPGIADLDLNVERIRQLSSMLGPEVPLSVSLTPQSPTNWAMPTGLSEAMQTLRTGDMFRDMSKSDVLGSAVGELAKVAQAIAEKAGDLSGEAMQNALEQAASLGNKTADIAGELAGEVKAPPPRTPTERVVTMNELQRQSENPAPPPVNDPAPIDVAKAETMGADLGHGGSSGIAGSSDPSKGGPEGNDYGPLSEGACRYDDETEIADSLSTPFVLHEMSVDSDAGPAGEPAHPHWNLYTYALGNFAVGEATLPASKWTEAVVTGLTEILLRGGVSNITYAPVVRKYYAVGLRVTGFSDCTGDAEANVSLRRERADTVTALMRAFITESQANDNADFERLDAVAIVQNAGGAAQGVYLADNGDRIGRSQNRAVAIEEFWYPLDTSQVPPELITNPVSVEERVEIGETLVREREDEIRVALAAFTDEPQYMLDSAACVLEKILRVDTQVRYFDVGAVNTYIADNTYEQFGIPPEDYPRATDARANLYKDAYNNPDPERLARKLIGIYRALKDGVRRVYVKSTLSAVGDADTVQLSDWMKAQTNAPRSIYSCHLGQMADNLEWWLFR